MKRISLVAAAALLVAGAQLHAQATKQDTSKKATKHAAAQQAGAAKHDAKTAAKSADTSHKAASATHKDVAKPTKHDSATKKKG